MSRTRVVTDVGAYEADDDWTLGRGWDDRLDETDTGEVPAPG